MLGADFEQHSESKVHAEMERLLSDAAMIYSMFAASQREAPPMTTAKFAFLNHTAQLTYGILLVPRSGTWSHSETCGGEC